MVCVSSKGVDKGQAICFPLLFFPFCRDSIVSLQPQCVVSPPMSTPTQPNSTLQLKLTSTKPQMNKSWVRKHQLLPSPAETASSPKSQMVKVTDLQTVGRMWNYNEMYEFTKKSAESPLLVPFWTRIVFGLLAPVPFVQLPAVSMLQERNLITVETWFVTLRLL